MNATRIDPTKIMILTDLGKLGSGPWTVLFWPPTAPKWSMDAKYAIHNQCRPITNHFGAWKWPEHYCLHHCLSWGGMFWVFILGTVLAVFLDKYSSKWVIHLIFEQLTESDRLVPFYITEHSGCLAYTCFYDTSNAMNATRIDPTKIMILTDLGKFGSGPWTGLFWPPTAP